jgi:uncharacterized repeat protein (TIGR01451 family)
MSRVRCRVQSFALTALACLAWSNAAMAQSQLAFAGPVTINPASGLDQQGGNIGYTFTVKNSGSASAADTKLSVTFRPNNIPIFDSTKKCVFTRSTTSLVASCPLGSIPAGTTTNPKTATVVLVVHPTNVDPRDVSAEVTEGGVSRATQTGTSTITAVGISDVSVAADVSPNPAWRGSPLTYIVKVANCCDDDAQEVVATLVLPANTTFVTASKGCTHVGDLVTCKIGHLTTAGPNSTRTVKVEVKPMVCGYAYATVGARLKTPDPTMNNNAVGVQVFVNNTSTYTACP